MIKCHSNSYLSLHNMHEFLDHFLYFSFGYVSEDLLKIKK